MLSFEARSDLQRKVRAAFVKHWIDLGRITLHISSSGVHIRGTLARMPGVSAELTPAIVDSIFTEMMRIPGMPRLDIDLDNWESSGPGAGWRPAKKPRGSAAFGRDAASA